MVLSKIELRDIIVEGEIVRMYIWAGSSAG